MRKIILPLDAYPTSLALLKDMRRMLSSSSISDLLAYIKINDGVHFIDAGGPEIFQSIHFELANRGLPIGIFLDLKIFDVSATLENVLRKYTAVFLPDILTVSSSCSVNGIIKLRQLLPNTKLAMVSVLTDIGKDECSRRFGKWPAEKIADDLLGIKHCYNEERRASKKLSKLNPEPFDMIVCSPHEVFELKRLFGEYEFIVPGIRDEWMRKTSEHQKRITGVKKALENGATYVVMGAQIIKGNPEKNISPRSSCQLTNKEIESFFNEKSQSKLFLV